MEQELKETFESARCFLGGVQTGKTQAVLERALSFAQVGQSVCILCAFPAGMADVNARLDQMLDGEHAQLRDQIRVCLAQDIALEILSETEAYELLQRKPRILEHVEEQVLFEDIRTTSFKGRRLKDVLYYIKAGWSRMADDDENWLITLEEEAVASIVRQSLRFTGGMLACEVGNLVVRALRDCESLRARYAFDVVLVDDYQLLDRASQLLSRMLARTSFGFSADEMPSLAALAEFPYLEGVEEFLQEHPETEIERLDESALPHDVAALIANSAQTERAVEAEGKAIDLQQHASKGEQQEGSDKQYVSSGARGREDGDAQRENGGVFVSMEDDMAAELRVIAAICQKAIEAGDDVIIVGSNSLWRANVYKNFRAAGFSISRSERRLSIKDFRDERGCAALRQMSMQRLREDPHDGVAWRNLLACGDYMARSNTVKELREIAQPLGLNIEEALEQLERGQLTGVDPADDRLASLQAIYRNVRQALSEQEQQDESAATAVSVPGTPAETPVQTPVQSEQQTGSIFLSSPDEVLGLRAPVVIFGGFVNGCIPSRAYLDGTSLLGTARQRAQIKDLQRIRRVAGCATRALHFTGFTSCSLETAERMELRIARIKLQRGARVCQIEPSEYLTLL